MINRVLPSILALAVIQYSTFGQSARFIEVQVTDTVRLPMEGIDYEVRMANPFDVTGEMISASGEEEPNFQKTYSEAEKKVKADEARFLELMRSNGFTYRLSETEHAEDYVFESRKKYDVNTYLVQLKDGPQMEKYASATEGTSFIGAVKEVHYADAGSQAPRLMKKVFEQAKKKAEALIAVTGGHLGAVLSAQEVQPSEGSILEQLFKLDKGGNKEEMMWTLGSSHRSTVAFRFELMP